MTRGSFQLEKHANYINPHIFIILFHPQVHELLPSIEKREFAISV